MGIGNPADKGRAGTVSPTHPHNEPSLDGYAEAKRKERKEKKNRQSIMNMGCQRTRDPKPWIQCKNDQKKKKKKQRVPVGGRRLHDVDAMKMIYARTVAHL